MRHKDREEVHLSVFIMSQDIARYIEIVGKDNLKRHLKENLKAELSKAIQQENWQLIKEITKLLEIIINKANSEDDLVWIRCIEIVGISQLNLQLKSFLNTNIENEQWSSAQEIAKILGDCLSFDNAHDVAHIKSSLKSIMYESIDKEDWYLTECIVNILKANFSPSDNYTYIIDEQNIKLKLKKALHELITINNYSLAIEIITIIQKNLIRHTQQIEKTKKDSEKLEKEYKIYNTEVYEKLKTILVDQLEIQKDRIEPDSTIYKRYFRGFWNSSGRSCSYDSDLGCDDLDIVELIMAIEEEFDLEINDEQQEKIVTVKDLYDVVVCNLEE